jgi:glycosyltransferase involved in cell wall biosynthesis
MRPAVRSAIDAESAPLVSVVIPCYNQARFLCEAIESARAQTYPAVEIVVVDDGSSDDTSAVAAQYPSVRCIRQENRGLAAARNAGCAGSRGALTVFLDADDRLLPEAIDTGVRLLASDPSLGFVAGYSRFISGDGRPLPTDQPSRAGTNPYLALMRRNSIRNPAMVMFRRRVLDEMGGFDSRIDACADYDMYLRISRRHAVAFHDSVVAEYRKHADSMSNDAALMLRQLHAVMRAQRAHLVTRAHRDAFRAGRRQIREYYGDRLATQIRDRCRARTGWLRAIKEASTLIRCHPLGAVEHARRKIVCWWRGGEASSTERA